jgi:hypothetical protein
MIAVADAVLRKALLDWRSTLNGALTRFHRAGRREWKQ